MEINNNPNKNAPKSFVYDWEDFEDVANLYNKDITVLNNGYKSKFLGKFATIDGEENDGYCYFENIYIYLVEFNAYYIGEYSSSIWEDRGSIEASVHETYFEKIVFKLLPDGKHHLEFNDYREEFKKYLKN